MMSFAGVRRCRHALVGGVAASFLAMAVTGCGQAPESGPARVTAHGWPTFVGRQAVKDAFDRQARVDGTDHTVSECPDVHAVMSCAFAIDAFARDVPEEAKAAGAPAGEMPDEVLDIVGPGSEPVTSVGLDGNGATPARRYHYIGQFKTLIRVLSPAIEAAEIDRLVYDLQLGATPQQDLRTAARRPFADITCAQGGGASAYIQCQAEKPQD